MSLVENVLVAIGRRQRYRAASVLFPSRRFHLAEQSEREAARDLLSRVGLADKAQRFAGTLSYGEQRRLEIARALATSPRLLLLDEPAAGMNSSEKQQLAEEIVKLHGSGITILIIEHDMRFIMELCQQIVVLNFGQVIAQGSPNEVRTNLEVIEAYLGREGQSP